MKKQRNYWRKLWVLPVFSFALAVGLFLFTDSASAGLSYETPTQYASGEATNSHDICKLDSTHVFLVYMDTTDNQHGKAKVGTITGSTMSWSPEYIFNNEATDLLNVACLSDSKVVVTYLDADGKGKAILMNISTSTWTVNGLGIEAAYDNTVSGNNSVARLSDTKFVITFESSASYTGEAIIGDATVGPNFLTISYGSPVQFDVSGGSGIFYNSVAALVQDSDPYKFVVAYSDYSDNDSKARVGTVSGNTITFGGSNVTFDSRNSTDESFTVAALSTSSFAIAFYEDVFHGVVTLGNLDGTYGIEFSTTPKQIEGDQAGNLDIDKIDGTHFIVTYVDDNASSYASSRVGTIEGSSIIFSGKQTFNAAGITEPRVIMMDSQKVVSAYYENATGQGYTAIGTYTTQTLNLGNIRSVQIDLLNHYLAVVSVHNSSRIDIHWTDSGGVHPIPNVLSGTNISLLHGGGIVKDPLDSTRIYFGYTLTASPTALYLVHYDLDSQQILDSGPNLINSNVNFNAAFARETYNNLPIMVYGVGSTAYIYRNGSSSAITNAAVYDAPMAVTYDGSTNIYMAYQDASDLDLKTGYFTAGGSASITPLLIEAFDAAIYDLEAVGIRNSAIEVVYQTNTLAVKSASSSDGTNYTATTLETLTNTVDTSAVELTDNTKAVAVYYDGTNLVRQEITQATGASTKTTIQSGPAIYISPTISLSTSDVESYVFGIEDYTPNVSDGLFSFTEGDPAPIQFDQQDEGPTVPELPSNVVWKIIIALMSMGAVIAIAAVFRKRGVKEAQTELATGKAPQSKKPVVKTKTARTTKSKK